MRKLRQGYLIKMKNRLRRCIHRQVKTHLWIDRQKTGIVLRVDQTRNNGSCCSLLFNFNILKNRHHSNITTAKR